MMKLLLLLTLAIPAAAQDHRVEAVNAPGQPLQVYASLPRIYASSASVTLSSTTATEVVAVYAAGEVEAIMVNFDRTQVVFSIEVDSVTIFSQGLDDLSTNGLFNLVDGGSTAAAFPVVVARAGKQFFLRFSTPKRMYNSFKIKARKTVTGATAALSSLVIYGVDP